MHFDITPANQAEVVTRVARFVAEADPAAFDAGRNWYDAAHDAAISFGRLAGVKTRNAAGVIAAISPQLDAEANLDPMWIAKIIVGQPVAGRGAITGAQRDKAGRCLQYDPTDVLDPRTGPKTWNFFWNIWAPTLRDHVTIDGRYADVLANRMLGWKDKRGIDTGGPGSRYERFAFVTEDVARNLRAHGFPWMTAPQVQAIAWCEAKRIERVGITTRGTVRKNGPHRKGQPYT